MRMLRELADALARLLSHLFHSVWKMVAIRKFLVSGRKQISPRALSRARRMAC